MICTCTLNPSLDYFMEGDRQLQPGKLNRSQLEYYEAGGKGINVSIVLNNLGIPTRAFGFIGGFTKDFYIDLLAKYEFIRPNFTYTEGHTRINVKLRNQDESTDINATGPYITDVDMQNLMGKVSRLSEGDYLVLAGNTQDYLVEDVKKMLQDAVREKVRVCMDTDPRLMKDMLGAGLFMIKTTPAELSSMVDFPLNDEAALIKAGRQLHDDGVQNVLILSENRDALLVCDKGVYRAALQRESKAVNTVGTGDALVAGFLMDYLRSREPVDSFRFGASCGSANVYSRGLATREKIDSFYETTKVRKISD